MTPYDPNTRVSFLALSKLEESSIGISILSDLERNAERFKDAAGFSLNKQCREQHVRRPLAYEYIESWKAEKSPKHQPTWSSLLEVLKEVGLDSMAENIEGFLKMTSPAIEPTEEHEEQEDGILSNFSL